MNAMMKNDVRTLSPSFIATIAVTILAALLFNGSDASELVAILYTPCAVFMAATVFGTEFSSRTMLQLLSQPISRERIWRDKMSVLGIELVVSYVVLFCAFLFSVRFHLHHIFEPQIPSSMCFAALALASLPLICFCSTPFMTLRAKNTLGAVAFTVTTPFLIVMLLILADTGLCWLMGRPKAFGETFSDAHPGLMFCGVAVLVLVYCAGMYRAGYETFMSYELIDTQSQEIALPSVIERGLARWMPSMSTNHPVASLVWKELRLQRVSFMGAGIATISALIAFAIGALHRSEEIETAVGVAMGICVFLMPFLTGLVSVADERNIGVLEWQLMQPVSRRRQWMIKLFTTFFISISLGVLLPAGMFYLAPRLLGSWPDKSPGPLLFFTLGSWIFGYICVFALVLLGSAISSNVSRGMAASLFLLVTFSTAIALGSYWGGKAMSYLHHLEGGVVITDELNAFAHKAEMVIVIVLIVLGFLRLHHVCYQHFHAALPSPRRTWTQVLGIVLFVFLAVFLNAVLVPLTIFLFS